MPGARQGVKRAATADMATLAPPSKKDHPCVAGVAEAIEKADLPESCKTMLAVGLPHLGTASADSVREILVDIIGEAVGGVRAQLQQVVDAS